MPFRFNQKDLAVLAVQPSDLFTKEGLLWFKEKDGKLFNKSENFSERLFRLRGNLLFYFKGKDKSAECNGVIVLERYKLYPDSQYKKHGFVIEFDDPEERKYEFAASSKVEYDNWFGLFKNASYEKLKNRLLELRSEIVNLTGQDPLPDYHPVASTKPVIKKENRISLCSPLYSASNDCNIIMEMCIACANLNSESESLPSAMVKVYTVVPPVTEWTKHSQTEISEECRDPNFLRTIVITNELSPVTRLKFVIYDVLSKSKNDTVTLGQSVCTIQEIQQASNWKLSLNIMNMETSVGTLIIQGWRRESNGRFRTKSVFEGTDARDGSILEASRSYTTNIVQRGFHFPTNDGSDLKFQEFLAESILCFKIPKLLLGLFIAEEKKGVVELHNIGQLHPEWEGMKQVVQNSHFDLVHHYSTNQADLCQYEESNFKRSVDKTKKELEFIPTNLHIQRLCVIEKDKKEYFYDVITVGAPTAHSLKYKHGGLKRLILNSEESTRKALQGSGEEEKRKTAYIKSCHVKEVLNGIKKEVLKSEAGIRKAIDSEDSSLLNETATQISNKIGELLGLCATSFVQECEQELLKARTTGPELYIKSTVLYSDIDDERIKELDWGWTGTEFKGSNTKQKDNDCGVFDAMGNFMSAVNKACKTDDSFDKDELHGHLEMLDIAVDSLCRKLNVTMRFILMQEEADCPGLKDLRYRRDIVFSQTLTPVVAGFVLMLSRRLYDQTFMQQITDIGLLIYYESLLTTAGDEMGMLEDMYTGLLDLRQVSFKIVSSEADSYPTVIGTRSAITVEFPIKPKQFHQLPLKLQERQVIRLHPVIFSMGINEQATLAEKFGDTTLQETINAENLSYLHVYMEAFLNLYPNHVGSRSTHPTSLVNLMDQLKSTLNTKRNKNYEILLLAEEICSRINGLRLTSCKSAKDRSSMSVTLESVRTLEREHDMKEDVSSRVLSSIRSQGTRLINSYKNVGLPKYAFNKVQVKALPSIYRPPEGTIGKYLQT